MNGIKILSLAFTGLMMIAGCKKEDNIQLKENIRQDFRQEMDVPYGDDVMQRMDVYFPQGYNNATPVVFLIHGGGFVAGTKEDFTPQAVMFRDQGFIVVNLSHRLVDTTGMFANPTVHKPSAIKIADQLQDIDAAIREYISSAPGWNAGSGRMYIAGGSAGAILATLYANSGYNKDKHIRASGNWCGATDLCIYNDAAVLQAGPWYVELFYRATGAIPAIENNDFYKAVSPFWQVAKNNGAIPHISILPSNTTVFSNVFDEGFGITPARNFHTLLSSYHTREKLVIYPDENHTFSNHPDSWNNLIEETAFFFRAN